MKKTLFVPVVILVLAFALLLGCTQSMRALQSPQTSAPQGQQMVGNDRDAHGCIPSAGYSWCEAKNKCLRQWEEQCTSSLRVLTEDFPPYNFKDSSGKITGRSTAIVREIMNRLNQTSEIELVDFSNGYSLLLSGPNVAMYSIGRTPEREDKFKWAGPIGDWEMTLYAANSSDTLISSFDGTGTAAEKMDVAKNAGKICVVKDDVRYQFLVQNNFTNLDAVAGDADCPAKLASGQDGLWFGSSTSFEKIVAEANLPTEAFRAVYAVGRNELYVAFSLDVSDAVVSSWQNALDDMALPAEAAPTPDGLVYKGSFEGGLMYKTANDKFYVLNLHGSYREMGRQYGYLMKDELNRTYNGTAAYLLQSNITMKDLASFADSFYDTLPSRFKDVLRGMSETSGLTLEQHKMLNAGTIELVIANMLREAGPAATQGCSGVAFWGNYSKDGKLYFGRNWDMNLPLLQPYLQSMTVAVYHPADGSNAVANLEFAGEVYTETAMNEKGIFLELNNGGQSDPSNFEGKRVMGVVKLLEFLFDSSDMDDIDREFNTTLDSDSYIIQVANKDVAYSYEWPTFGVRRRSENVSGLLVTYNSFVPPYPVEWEGRIVPPDPRDERREHFLVLANSPEYKGKMDAELMKQFLSVKYQDGGRMLPQNVFQVVAIPEDLTLWLKGQNYSDFEKIDLKPLFEN